MFSGTTFRTELRILLFVIVRNTTEGVCVVSRFFLSFPLSFWGEKRNFAFLPWFDQLFYHFLPNVCVKS